MESETEAKWWQRLLYGFGALVFMLYSTAALITIRNFIRVPGIRWSNGGEIQIFLYFLFFGGELAFATYLFFVTPLVLLWPARSQRRNWLGMLCAAMIWPPLLNLAIFGRRHPLFFLADIRQHVGSLVFQEFLALCCCGIYLVLLHWQHRRLETKLLGWRHIDKAQVLEP